MSIDITNIIYSNVVQIAQQLNKDVAIKRTDGIIRLVVE
jgi:hypothetical protein